MWNAKGSQIATQIGGSPLADVIQHVGVNLSFLHNQIQKIVDWEDWIGL